MFISLFTSRTFNIHSRRRTLVDGFHSDFAGCKYSQSLPLHHPFGFDLIGSNFYTLPPSSPILSLSKESYTEMKMTKYFLEKTTIVCVCVDVLWTFTRWDRQRCRERGDRTFSVPWIAKLDIFKFKAGRRQNQTCLDAKFYEWNIELVLEKFGQRPIWPVITWWVGGYGRKIWWGPEILGPRKNCLCWRIFDLASDSGRLLARWCWWWWGSPNCQTGSAHTAQVCLSWVSAPCLPHSLLPALVSTTTHPLTPQSRKYLKV